jgi:hypothetical protein
MWPQAFRADNPLQSVNSLGTAVTGRALNRYNAWAAIRKRAKAAGFLTPVGCYTWRATGIQFTRKTMDGWSTPNRWPDMSRPARPNFTTGRSGFNSAVATAVIYVSLAVVYTSFCPSGWLPGGLFFSCPCAFRASSMVLIAGRRERFVG